jgi:uncharacterized membrane protein
MRYLIALLAVCGVVVSALAVHVHYSTGVEPCDINSHWDCGIVNHSSFATVNGLWWHLRADHNPALENSGPAPRTGLPVAVLGVVGYGLIGLLALMRKRWLTVAFAAVALCFALYLSNIEAHVLEVWCLYCVISQFTIALITLLSIGWLFAPRRRA